jgi:TolB protein
VRNFLGLLLAIFGVMSSPVWAQRQPVLPQIDLPHPYYYRELYLPQLTSGPSSLSWSPDSKALVYSMGGSIWRQNLDSVEPEQLTDGSGYDYQPDWSPDGKAVVFVRYEKDAMELWHLDLATKKTTPLTSGGAVNAEPRWSPDGRRILWVSTQYNKRFHVFVADVKDGALGNVTRLTGETKSSLPRYYYSAFDTEINPAWTRDGKEIIFVCNRGHIYGSGGFWRMKAEAGAEAREIHYEETSWKARPDFSPDGTRMVFSSYLGRQWHNLWVMPAAGGDAFPIAYAEWDQTEARWSPDGKEIAYISNFTGSTAIEIQEIPGGNIRQVTGFDAKALRFINAVGTLRISIEDELGGPTSARVSVTDANGKFGSQQSAVVYADDGFDRKERGTERHYIYAQDSDEFVLPEGKTTIEVSKGLEYAPQEESVEVKAGKTADIHIRLRRTAAPWRGRGHWSSSDLHVHMNYGGTYRNDVDDLAWEGDAEGLQSIHQLTVNKEQRFPNIDLVHIGEDFVGESGTQIFEGQEFHTSYWGHRGILGLRDHLLLPGYAGYPNTAAASLFPMNADVYDMAHAQGALVGAVHPFDEAPDPFAKPAQRITDELPVDVALGKLDYMEIVGFSDHKGTAAVWYRLLNLGFRLPAGAGTDATANYAAPIRGQVGQDRVYVWTPQWPAPVEMWKAGLREGHTFATNGPLLEFTLGGQMVGSELKFDAAQTAVPFTARMTSIVPVDHVEVVCNGKVTQEVKVDASRKFAEMKGGLAIEKSGWCALRAWSERAEYPVMDGYTYATTSPVYVTVGGKRAFAQEDADYFKAWVERMMEITGQYPDWNSADEKAYVMKKLADARAVYEGMK